MYIYIYIVYIYIYIYYTHMLYYVLYLLIVVMLSVYDCCRRQGNDADLLYFSASTANKLTVYYDYMC